MGGERQLDTRGCGKPGRQIGKGQLVGDPAVDFGRRQVAPLLGVETQPQDEVPSWRFSQLEWSRGNGRREQCEQEERRSQREEKAGRARGVTTV